MDGDEQVGLGLVGYTGTLGQRDVHIGGACIDNLHIGTIVLYQFSQFQSHLQGQILFLRLSTHSAGFVASVAGINHYSPYMSDGLFLRKSGSIYADKHNKKGK